MEHVPFLLVNNEKLRTKETSRLCKRALYRYRIVKNNAFAGLKEDGVRWGGRKRMKRKIIVSLKGSNSFINDSEIKDRDFDKKIFIKVKLFLRKN